MLCCAVLWLMWMPLETVVPWRAAGQKDTGDEGIRLCVVAAVLRQYMHDTVNEDGKKVL
jgi:hypothetical protein